MNPLSLILGVTFLVAGLVMYFFPAKKPNVLYGYRTNRSMRDLASWQFSQRYSSLWMMGIGASVTVEGIILSIFNLEDQGADYVIIGLTILGIILMVFFTEKKLKEME